MAIAYHIDRTCSLQTGMKIELDDNYFNDACQENPFFAHLFSKGLSRHGIRYLEGFNPNVSHIADLNSYLIEVEFELIRAIYFNHVTSRFQSLFAIPSLDDLSKWPILTSGSYSIFEIEYDETKIKVFDANFLGNGINPFGITYKPWDNFYNAYNYFSGKMSDNPTRELALPLPVTIGKKIK